MKVGKFSYWKIDPESISYQISGSKDWPDWPVQAPEELVQEAQCFVNEAEPDIVVFLPWDKPELGRWAQYGSILKRYPSTERDERVDAGKWWTLRRGEELAKESMVNWSKRTGNRLIESDQLTGAQEVKSGSKWSKDFRTSVPSKFNPGGKRHSIGIRGKSKLTEKLTALVNSTRRSAQ